MSDVFSHLRRILWKPTKIKPKVEETQNFPLWHLGELLTKINTIFIGEPDIFDLFGTTWFLSHGAFNLKKKQQGQFPPHSTKIIYLLFTFYVSNICLFKWKKSPGGFLHIVVQVLKIINANFYKRLWCNLIFRLEYMGFELEKVKKFETPYGARFEWSLLTDQKLVVHLKDKTKIRNRKRWSQVN